MYFVVPMKGGGHETYIGSESVKQASKTIQVPNADTLGAAEACAPRRLVQSDKQILSHAHLSPSQKVSQNRLPGCDLQVFGASVQPLSKPQGEWNPTG